MRMSRFEHLLDAHGADLGRWPPAEAQAARVLLMASPEAQALLHRAATLEDALRESRALPDAATLARMRTHVAGRVARMPLPERPGALAWLRPLLPFGGGALATLLACGLWLTFAPLSEAPDFSAPRQIAMIESTE
ncbi:hypothetical protein EBE87_10475 [Pseudoroseomonas wenyumeiae]|uniref:Uncharacterized protein n=4 Tax=Teichococcus wenyumeiae TaxID=2478470 RepID=A0ABX9VKD1_9PROT|nr:hypothetical protein EBE87_10475 [Pseudoroseomonas wenyumeiae]